MNAPEGMTSVHEEKPQLFLEVGTRSSPVFLVGTRRLSPNERYIGIDISAEEVRRGVDAAQSVQPGAADRMLFVNADGTRLPIRDGVIHEALLNNVLGDPKTWNREMLIQELFRALADGGTLTVAEMYSPSFAPEDSTIQRCQDAGFVLRNLTVPKDSRWNEIAPLYGRFSAGQPDPDAFVAEFVKPPTR